MHRSERKKESTCSQYNGSCLPCVQSSINRYTAPYVLYPGSKHLTGRNTRRVINCDRSWTWRITRIIHNVLSGEVLVWVINTATLGRWDVGIYHQLWSLSHPGFYCDLCGREGEQMFVVAFHNATQIQLAPEKTIPARKNKKKSLTPTSSTNSITASTLQTSSLDHRHLADSYSSSAQWSPSAAAALLADPGA